MPLRDHFRPPLDDMQSWESFHAAWPIMIVAQLRRKLPRRYRALPKVHSGVSAEIDVATFESDEEGLPSSNDGNGNGGVATTVWATPRPTLVVSTDLPEQDEYEVRVYDEKRHSRLVAAVEIVSPANKDRPDHRNSFVAKCADLLRQQVSVVIVDLVTTRTQNLYGELLDLLELSDPGLSNPPPGIYTAACRLTKRDNKWLLEAWMQPLALGQLLPTKPLWLADNLAVSLELEESYEQSCTILGIP